MASLVGLNEVEMLWLKDMSDRRQCYEIKVMDPLARTGLLDCHWPALRQLLKSVDDPNKTYLPDATMITRNTRLMKKLFPSATETELYRLLKKTSIVTLTFVALSYCLAKEFGPYS
jgi:hypothetical protein